MAGEVVLGPYVLGEESRGLRIRRTAQTPGGELRAVLMLSIAEQDAAEDFISIRRLTQVDENTAEIHGFSTDHIAFDARVVWRPEYEGLQFSVEIMNSTEDMAMRFAAQLEMTGEADPEWLIPGLFYNENRPRECERIYPAYSEIQRDPDKFLSNHWSFRSDRAAMPLVLCQTYHAIGFLAGEEDPGIGAIRPAGFGISSIGFGTEEGFPVLSYRVPYIEEPVKYSFCHDERTRAEMTFYKLEKNELFATTMHVGLLPTTPGAREKVYRGLYNEYWTASELKPKISGAEAEKLSIEGITRWHLNEKTAMIYESAAFDRHFGQKGTNVERLQMHSGWLSGAFPAYVLLWHGRDVTDPMYVRAAHGVLDHLTRELAPCGTLYPVITEEDGPMAAFGPDQGLAHSRTIAEAVFYLIRAHRLELQANTTHQQWISAIMSTLNFILKKQREDGAFPDYWYLDDGEVYGYNGAAGMCWIPALVGCSHMVASTTFREAAIKAGEYYSKFIEDGLIYGCNEDQPFVPTCEDCHQALIAYMMLYELDRSQRWFDLARKAADLALTWRMSYNITFSQMSMLGQANLCTRGGDICSVATPSLGAYGLISYAEMKKLAALSGDQYYEQRAEEARTFATQLLARVDGEFNARRGMAIGQLFHTDWWQPKGMVLSLSTVWTAALIEYAELIERHLDIPTAAIEGDTRGIAEATLRSGIVALGRDIVLPDPAEVRRQKEIAARRSREVAVPSAAQLGGKIEQLTPQSLRRNTGQTPIPEDIAPAAFGALPPRQTTRPASRIEESEHDTNKIEIPRKEFPRQATPVPPEQKFFPLGVPGSSDAVPKLQEEKQGVFSDAETPKLPKELPWKPATSAEQPKRQRPATQFGEQEERLPRREHTPFEFTKPREEPRKKTPLGSRHVPLSAEERFGTDHIDHSKLADLRSAQFDEMKTPMPLSEPPPSFDGGLLADLMKEDTRPRFTPLADLPDHPSFPTAPTPEEEEEIARDADERIEIKWKIF